MSDIDIEYKIVNEIKDELSFPPAQTGVIVEYLNRHGWIRDPGRLIDPNDIRKGDRYRVEWDSVRTYPSVNYGGTPAPKSHSRHTLEKVSGGGDPRIMRGSWEEHSHVRFFLLERPAPTNAEKLAKEMLESFNRCEFDREPTWKQMAEALDARGVKAPGGDDE